LGADGVDAVLGADGVDAVLGADGVDAVMGADGVEDRAPATSASTDAADRPSMGLGSPDVAGAVLKPPTGAALSRPPGAGLTGEGPDRTGAGAARRPGPGG
jgi:hypothetical protein